MKIGPQMKFAAELVQQAPGQVTRKVAIDVGPSQSFGYATINRAVLAGLIERRHVAGNPVNWTRLFPA